MPPVRHSDHQTATSTVRAFTLTIVGRDTLDELAEEIEAFEPDVVVLDFDESRWKWLADDEFRAEANLVEIIKRKEMAVLNSRIAAGVLAKRSAPPGRGVKVADEMLIAFETANALGVPIVFGGRPIEIVGRRAWQATAWLKRAPLAVRTALSSMRRSKMRKVDEDDEDLEGMRESFDTDRARKKMRRILGTPASTVFLEESARWLAGTVSRQQGRVLVVTSQLQWERAENYLGEENSDDLLTVSPPSLFGRALPWLFSAAIIGAFVIGFAFGDFEKMQTALLAWCISNATLAALGAAAAGSHTATIVITGLSAPFVSLNPAVGAGLVGAVVQAWVVPPTIEDIDNVGDDITHWKGWWRNKLAKIILVFVFANISSTIGSFVALGWLP